jgi:hypothetical protein
MPAGTTHAVITDGVTNIGHSAFTDCSNLTQIEIPAGVTSIGNCAFYGCSRITQIEIPEGVTSIGWEAFKDCTSLTQINLPEGITSIGQGAFYGCSSLRAIILPDHFCTDAEKQRLGISEAVRCISYNAITQFYSDSLQVKDLYNTGQKIALYRLCTDESFGQHDLSPLQDCLMADIISAIRKREQLLGASGNNTILSNRLISVNQSTQEVSSKLYTRTQQLPENIISYLTAKDFCNLRTVKSGGSDQSNAPELTVKQFSLFNKITCYRCVTALAIVGIAAAALMYSQFATIVAIVGIAALLYKLNHSSNHRRSSLGME